MERKYIDTVTGTINLINDTVYEGLPESVKKEKQLYEVEIPKIIKDKFDVNENANSAKSAQQGSVPNDGGTIQPGTTDGNSGTGDGSGTGTIASGNAKASTGNAKSVGKPRGQKKSGVAKG